MVTLLTRKQTQKNKEVDPREKDLECFKRSILIPKVNKQGVRTQTK